MAHEAHPNRAPHQQAVQDAQTTHPWDLFRRAPGFICVLRGPNHVFEFANDCYLRLVGGREVIGKPLREALPEIAAQPFPDILDRVYQTGEPYTAFETPVELRCAPGAPSQRRILNFVYQPFQDAQGRTTGVFVEGFDVTEFKRAKMATVRLASIVKSCDDAIISKDLQGHVISWNPSAERLFGYTAQEAIGRTISELIIPANRQDEEADILRRLARDEATDHYETVRHRKDGSTLDVSVTISPLREDGKIVGG
jgi:PAS domain S-box-containing protein